MDSDCGPCPPAARGPGTDSEIVLNVARGPGTDSEIVLNAARGRNMDISNTKIVRPG